MWNDGIVRDDCIYIFCNTIEKKTYILKQSDILSDKEYEYINEVREERRVLNLKHRQAFKDLGCDYMFTI